MKALVQRVTQSNVRVENELISEIQRGLLVLLGVAKTDQPQDADYLAKKIVGLRIFENQAGKMDLSVEDIRGDILVVPQFTLIGDCRKGRRPDFTLAASPEMAENLYQMFCQNVENLGLHVKKGKFQEHMHVSLVNDGPVTLWIESKS